jgi:phosphoglycerate kinase
MSIVRMTDLDLTGKRVLIRQDLNVPVADGRGITSDQRITASIPTLRLALEKGAAVMVTSHLGRPKEGTWSEADSLAPVAARLSELLGFEVPLVRDYLDGVDVQPGQLVLLENCRMNIGEGKDDEALSKRYAALCDVFVMDAFGTAHRAQASTHGAIRFAKQAAGGPLLMAELDALDKALASPARPLLAIVAGSKVSTKLELLSSLVGKVDQLIVGGGIANTFIAAARPWRRQVAGGDGPDRYGEADHGRCQGARRGHPVAARRGGRACIRRGCAGHDQAHRRSRRRRHDPRHRPTDRAGPTRHSSRRPAPWSGTARSACSSSTPSATAPKRWRARSRPSPAFSIAGGGDTLAAVDKYAIENDVSYISTGGGAFLEFLEGKPCRRVAALEARGGGSVGRQSNGVAHVAMDGDGAGLRAGHGVGPPADEFASGGFSFRTGEVPAFVEDRPLPSEWPAAAPGAQDEQWRFWRYDRQVDHRPRRRCRLHGLRL